jgi:putative membrane protein
MKMLLITGILFTGSCFFFACNGNNSNTDTTTSSKDTTSSMANDTLGTKMDTSKNNAGTAMIDEKTINFTSGAATGGMMEVELGNMAAQKASNQSVKDFGKMMVDDHTKANDNLKNIASQKNIDLPASITSDQRKEIDALSKKSGAAFDKAYVNMMVDDHKKVIGDFKKAEGDVSDNDIKNFITNTLPVLQKHLDAIQAIKTKM